MNILSSQKFLTVYSGVLTIAFASVVLLGARKPDPNASFDQITVHRINVVEPEGTTRMVISDKAEFPGAFYMGKELPARADRQSAGILFNDDEGTENGGLLFGGGKDKDGKTSSYGHLSFDEYQRDQTLDMNSASDGSSRTVAYGINDDDRPYALTPETTAKMMAEYTPIQTMPKGPAKNAALAAFRAKYPGLINRGYFGRTPDKAVSLTLKDPQGNARLVARVAADGTPVLEFLDAKGNVLRTIGADTK